MYKTVIVEDEGPARRRLEKMVQTHPALQLVASLHNGQQAIERIPALQPDLLLLDIQLKDKTAFEVLDQIRMNIKSKIVFITAYDQYAIQAFDVEAIDYLLKPYDKKRFSRAIERVVQKQTISLDQQLMTLLQNSFGKIITKVAIPEGNKKHFFNGSDIVYVQADKYYVHVYTKTTEKVIRITLKKLAYLLPDNFKRINKSTIVNANYIHQVEKLKRTKKIKMENGLEFHVTFTYYRSIDG